MTAYDGTPNAVVQMLISGRPAYAFGSLPTGPNCRMLITSNSITSNVASLTVAIKEGNVPAVGDLIYVYATTNSSGAFNETTGIAIASVTVSNALTGVYVITFALSHGNQSPTADVGYAISVPQEVPELPAGPEASRAFAIQNSIGRGYGISWAYNCPSNPSSISIQLEGAVSNNSSEFTIIGSAQTVANAYTEVFATLPELVNFVRLNCTTFSGGTNPSLVGKILLS